MELRIASPKAVTGVALDRHSGHLLSCLALLFDYRIAGSFWESFDSVDAQVDGHSTEL